MTIKNEAACLTGSREAATITTAEARTCPTPVRLLIILSPSRPLWNIAQWEDAMEVLNATLAFYTAHVAAQPDPWKWKILVLNFPIPEDLIPTFYSVFPSNMTSDWLDLSSVGTKHIKFRNETDVVIAGVVQLNHTFVPTSAQWWLDVVNEARGVDRPIQVVFAIASDITGAGLQIMKDEGFLDQGIALIINEFSPDLFLPFPTIIDPDDATLQVFEWGDRFGDIFLAIGTYTWQNPLSDTLSRHFPTCEIGGEDWCPWDGLWRPGH